MIDPNPEGTAGMTRQLTPDDLQVYLQREGIDARLHRDVGPTPTVPAAARALGVMPEQIVKTLLFLVRPPEEPEQPIIVIGNGETRIDKRPLAGHFGVGRKRIKLAAPDVVLGLLGYPAGGVPPFGHRTPVPVILDATIPALLENGVQTIFGGGGDDHTMLELTVVELQRVTRPLVLAVS